MPDMNERSSDFEADLELRLNELEQKGTPTPFNARQRAGRLLRLFMSGEEEQGVANPQDNEQPIPDA